MIRCTRKLLIFIFLSSVACPSAFGQTSYDFDLLYRQLADAKDDTGRINAQIALCGLYRLVNTDSSLFYGEQALESAKGINYFQGQILALGTMSIVMDERVNLPKSMELGFKALQIAEEHHLDSFAASAAVCG